MLPRNILPWKILWFFYNLFKHMLPGHISENQFANKNRPTTCKIYENLVYAFHISKTDVTSYLQLFETKKKLYMPCLCFFLCFSVVILHRPKGATVSMQFNLFLLFFCLTEIFYFLVLGGSSSSEMTNHHVGAKSWLR